MLKRINRGLGAALTSAALLIGCHAPAPISSPMLPEELKTPITGGYTTLASLSYTSQSGTPFLDVYEDQIPPGSEPYDGGFWSSMYAGVRPGFPEYWMINPYCVIGYQGNYTYLLIYEQVFTDTGYQYILIEIERLDSYGPPPSPEPSYDPTPSPVPTPTPTESPDDVLEELLKEMDNALIPANTFMVAINLEKGSNDIGGGFGGSLGGGYSRSRANSETVKRAADAIMKWLKETGSEIKVITNKAGDKIFLAGSRRVRFDINDPSPHKNPHMHIEHLTANGRWRGVQKYPSDVDPL